MPPSSPPVCLRSRGLPTPHAQKRVVRWHGSFHTAGVLALRTPDIIPLPPDSCTLPPLEHTHNTNISRAIDRVHHIRPTCRCHRRTLPSVGGCRVKSAARGSISAVSHAFVVGLFTRLTPLTKTSAAQGSKVPRFQGSKVPRFQGPGLVYHDAAERIQGTTRTMQASQRISKR
jgi:hypothetical protein